MKKQIYKRHNTHGVMVGGVKIGGDAPVVVQSMTTTATEDVEASVAQVLRIARAGGQIVRLTAQGRRQVAALESIAAGVRTASAEMDGGVVPLVADIHFTGDLAIMAAQYVDKVRINPGNFVDKRANFEVVEYTDSQWNAELERIAVRVGELVEVCREYGTAVRVGVNHGSLSDRIMSRYGNTPLGMVVSAMEFLEVFDALGFKDVVVSIKSSNVVVMTSAYRMLAERMRARGFTYPLHLGVTEAGEGLQGRVRSAVGMGALLAQGLGDTLRVSLTEEPEAEIPAAQILASYFTGDDMWNEAVLPTFCSSSAAATGTAKREVIVVAEQGGDVTPDEVRGFGWKMVSVRDLIAGGFVPQSGQTYVLTSELRGADWVNSVLWGLQYIHAASQVVSHGATHSASSEGISIVVRKEYGVDLSAEQIIIGAAADFGALLLSGQSGQSGLVGGVWIDGVSSVLRGGLQSELSLEILQAARVRISKADIISCPGCGRTLYDLQGQVQRVKARFGDRAGLKLAVMGCMVNGPGEMADAQYGYVGAGPGLVTLYRGTQIVSRNIRQEEALDRLEELINQDNEQ